MPPKTKSVTPPGLVLDPDERHELYTPLAGASVKLRTDFHEYNGGDTIEGDLTRWAALTVALIRGRKGAFTAAVKKMIDDHLAKHPGFVQAKKREKRFYATIVGSAETWLTAHPETREAEAPAAPAAKRARMVVPRTAAAAGEELNAEEEQSEQNPEDAGEAPRMLAFAEKSKLYMAAAHSQKLYRELDAAAQRFFKASAQRTQPEPAMVDMRKIMLKHTSPYLYLWFCPKVLFAQRGASEYTISLLAQLYVDSYMSVDVESYPEKDELIAAIRIYGHRQSGESELRLLNATFRAAAYAALRAMQRHKNSSLIDTAVEFMRAALLEVEIPTWSPEVTRQVLRAAGMLAGAAGAPLVEAGTQIAASGGAVARAVPAVHWVGAPPLPVDFQQVASGFVPPVQTPAVAQAATQKLAWPASASSAPAFGMRAQPRNPRAQPKGHTPEMWERFFAQFQTRPDCAPPTLEEREKVKARFAPGGCNYFACRAFLRLLRGSNVTQTAVGGPAVT